MEYRDKIHEKIVLFLNKFINCGYDSKKFTAIAVATNQSKVRAGIVGT